MWVALETLILINLEIGVDVLHKQSRTGGEAREAEGEGEVTLIIFNLEMGVDVLYKQSRAGGEGERKPSL